jgi:hypothetical protein
MEINEAMRMCLFDIGNMYTNTPKAEVVNIIGNMKENNSES